MEHRRRCPMRLPVCEQLEPRYCLSSVAFVEHLLPNEMNATAIHSADVDSDGDPDIIGGLGSALVWYENANGAGSFARRKR